jgi:hypothetical protein
MASIRQQTLNIAGFYFLASACLAAFVFAMEAGAGLSDAYHSDPWWFGLLKTVLTGLQPPAAILVWAKLRANHPRVLLDGATIFSLAALAVVWSITIAFAMYLLRQRVFKARDEKKD